MPTTKQIAALKYMIFKAKNGTELSKRILAFLIDQSEGLTKEVCLTLVADREGYTDKEINETGHEMHSMESCNGSTHLNELLQLLDTDFHFCYHYGSFNITGSEKSFSPAGQFVGMTSPPVTDPDLLLEGLPLRYTFWLARGLYSNHATLLTTTRDELEQIDLSRPGLYKHEAAAF